MEIPHSGTFLVGTDRQRETLDAFQKREQHFAEEFQKNKPLCFSARAYQMTHPGKMRADRHGNIHKDADATLASPMMLGVADGVSQLEEFGIDASHLPTQLLARCEQLAMEKLTPDNAAATKEKYRGPVSLLKEAYETTAALGSTTILLGILDNSTRIHGKLHPMVAVLTIGDCELLMLRRMQGRQSPYQAVFHTEMQRIDGHMQTPLQLARVDDRVDPDFDEDIALEVIERGSAVHCVSTYEGDIVVLGSDGVFDNCFLDEIVDICNRLLPASRQSQFEPTHPRLLGEVAQAIVEACHNKTRPGPMGHMPETPIGRGGKMDDTSVVVGEVIEWTEAHSEIWNRVQTERRWNNIATCGGQCSNTIVPCRPCNAGNDVDEDVEVIQIHPGQVRKARRGSHAYEEDDEEDDDGRCCVM
jgi:protein phosphatase PTC7